MPKPKKNVSDLRDLLVEEIEKLRNGESNPVALNSISKAVGVYLNSVRLELEACKIAGTIPDIKALEGPK